jgi:hypothetical protein
MWVLHKNNKAQFNLYYMYTSVHLDDRKSYQSRPNFDVSIIKMDSSPPLTVLVIML